MKTVASSPAGEMTPSGSLRRRMLTAAGALTGILAATALLLFARIGPDTEGDRLDVNLVAIPSGEFDVEPKTVIRNARLKPGSPAAAGVMKVRNQTGRKAMASFRAEPSVPDVGRTLYVRATVQGKTIFEGALEDLEEWVQIPVAIQPGKDQTVGLSTRVKRSDRPIHGLSQDVTVSVEVHGSAAK